MSMVISENDQIIMTLVHYFVTKENYTPISVHGAPDEVWLENLEGPYRVIRINSNSIINEEQYKADLFKVKYIIKQIKRKTFSFKLNTLNICLGVSKKVDVEPIHDINSIKLQSIKDVRNNEFLINAFPGIKDELFEPKNNIDLIINVTNDINEKTEKNNRQYTKVFSPKKIIATKIIIALCILVFIATYIFGNGSNDILTLYNFGAQNLASIQAGQVWRLISATFLHAGFLHLFVNMYSLNIIGSQVETFVGRWKFLLIYFLSALSGSLLSMAMMPDKLATSVGASGAIFGLLGALLYFGYHYRLYLGDALKNQIIPIIILNLLFGFMISGIDVAAHIGGLIGGYLATMAVGLEGKSQRKDMINGSIVLILYIAFLAYIIFFIK